MPNEMPETKETVTVIEVSAYANEFVDSYEEAIELANKMESALESLDVKVSIQIVKQTRTAL